jgi:hypothetical protein
MIPSGSELDNFSIGSACFDSQLAMYQHEAASTQCENIGRACVQSLNQMSEQHRKVAQHSTGLLG